MVKQCAFYVCGVICADEYCLCKDGYGDEFMCKNAMGD
jgi:hypothetical protein